MLIERSWLDNYNSALRDISDGGQQALREQLRTVDYDRPMDEVRQDVTNIMEAVCATSTQSAALTSAGWYDGLRERSVGQSMGAAAVSGRNPASTAASVRAFLQRLIEGDYDAFEDLMCERLSYEVTRSAGNCVAENTRRDPHEVRYARVPQGDKTCGFCLMLASRGPVYYTEESAGMYLKYHAHCDCAIVPFFDTVPVYAEDGHYLGRRSADELEGYNPDELYRRYVHEMLSPQKPPSERPGYHPSGGERTYAAQWGRAYNDGRVTMGSIGEVSHAIRNAATYQELFDLIQLINRELEWYGASADVIRMWQRDLIAARNRLIA